MGLLRVGWEPWLACLCLNLLSRWPWGMAGPASTGPECWLPGPLEELEAGEGSGGSHLRAAPLRLGQEMSRSSWWRWRGHHGDPWPLSPAAWLAPWGTQTVARGLELAPGGGQEALRAAALVLPLGSPWRKQAALCVSSQGAGRWPQIRIIKSPWFSNQGEVRSPWWGV